MRNTGRQSLDLPTVYTEIMHVHTFYREPQSVDCIAASYACYSFQIRTFKQLYSLQIEPICKHSVHMLEEGQREGALLRLYSLPLDFQTQNALLLGVS